MGLRRPVRLGCDTSEGSHRNGRVPVGTVRDALQLPDIRRIELGYGMSVAGEQAGMGSLVGYSFNAGGAPLAAAFAASRAPARVGVMLVLPGPPRRPRLGLFFRHLT